MNRNELWYNTQISYAIACLDYTLQSNKSIEHRIHILIGVSSGAIGANNLMLQRIDNSSLWYLVFASAIPLLFSLACALAGLLSRLYNRHSVMVPEWIAKRPRAEYVIACRERSEQAMLDALAIENHAYAQAALYRALCYRFASWFFAAGALILLFAYAIFLVQKAPA